MIRVIVEVPEPGGSRWRVLLLGGYVSDRRFEVTRRNLQADNHTDQDATAEEVLVAGAQTLLRRRVVSMGYFDAFVVKPPRGSKRLADVYLPILQAFEPGPTKQRGTLLCLVEEAPTMPAHAYVSEVGYLGLVIRPEVAYSDPEGYALACKNLGEAIVHPYVAPCTFAERAIRQTGLMPIMP